MQATAHANSLTCPPGLTACGSSSSPATAKWLRIRNVQVLDRQKRKHYIPERLLWHHDKLQKRKLKERTEHVNIHGTCIQRSFYFSYKTIAQTQSLKKNTQRKFLFLLLLQKINNGRVIIIHICVSIKAFLKRSFAGIQQYRLFGFSVAGTTQYRSFDFMNFFKHLGSSNFGKRPSVSLKILLQVIVEIVKLQTTRVVNSFRRRI